MTKRDVGQYTRKVVFRMVGLAISALAGATVVGMIVIVPIEMLGELGLLSFRFRNHENTFWLIATVGAFWGIAHTLDHFRKMESGWASEPEVVFDLPEKDKARLRKQIDELVKTGRSGRLHLDKEGRLFLDGKEVR